MQRKIHQTKFSHYFRDKSILMDQHKNTILSIFPSYFKAFINTTPFFIHDIQPEQLCGPNDLIDKYYQLANENHHDPCLVRDSIEQNNHHVGNMWSKAMKWDKYYQNYHIVVSLGVIVCITDDVKRFFNPKIDENVDVDFDGLITFSNFMTTYHIAELPSRMLLG